MWRDRLNWDDELPTTIRLRWQRLVASLPAISHAKIPRWIETLLSSGLELHGFADASQAAYGAVVYAVITNQTGKRTVRLLASKTKVAPVKLQTIPRLELSAAVLLGRLLHKLKTAYGVRVTSLTAWTDSMITIAWIQSDPSRREIFVANRVSQIQRILPGLIWRHLPSEDNPADLASRGVDAASLTSSSLWWGGPPWLSHSRDTWPDHPALPSSERIEDTHQTCLVNASRDDAAFMERFSQFDRLLRVTVRCLRLPHLIRPDCRGAITRSISASDLDNTFHVCTRCIQRIAFPEEIKALRRGHSLGSRNRLAALSPFLDTDGTLRVGGRLHNARLPYSQRHPVILPKNCHLSRLIIIRAHKTALHGGPTLTYAVTMRTAWIIGGRAQCRAFVRQCVTCAKARSMPSAQMMGTLPTNRVEPSQPFFRTGLDYAGPFLLKASVGRGRATTKGYLAVFVCMCTKAVHLEIVGDLTTASFLGALHRFAARKTTPREVWSDNATTFHGADAELRSLFREAGLDWGRVNDDMSSLGIKWHFIPPSAPHFGGMWEAAVKSAKLHLKRTVG